MLSTPLIVPSFLPSTVSSVPVTAGAAGLAGIANDCSALASAVSVSVFLIVMVVP